MVMYTLVLHDTTRPNHRTMSTDVLNTCRQREMGVCSKGSTLKKVLQEKWEGREGGGSIPLCGNAVYFNNKIQISFKLDRVVKEGMNRNTSKGGSKRFIVT